MGGAGAGAPMPPMPPMGAPPQDPMMGAPAPPQDPMAAMGGDPSMMGMPPQQDPLAILASMFPSADPQALAALLGPALLGDQQNLATMQMQALAELPNSPELKAMLGQVTPPPPMVGTAGDFDRSATGDGGMPPVGY